MNIDAALKVAEEACKMQAALEAVAHLPFFEHEKRAKEYDQAAAALAKLRAELPNFGLLKNALATLIDERDTWSYAPVPVRFIEDAIATLARLEADPPSGGGT